LWVVELKPFKKLRYKIAKVGGDISKVVTLPYDIITPQKQEEYYKASPYSFVKLVLSKDEPQDGPNTKYERVKATLDMWIKDGILVEDDADAFYIYEQHYRSDGKVVKQAGIVGLVKIVPFEEGKILPHENILKGPLEDRRRLLKATKACLEMIIGLFPDRNNTAGKTLEKYMSGEPQLDFIHDDTIRHRVWKIRDKGDIAALQKLMKGNNIIIADGHHRYTTALKYYQESKDERFGHILMLLWPMDDKLNVLPTHRLLKGIPDKSKMVEKLKTSFDVDEVGGVDELIVRMADRPHSFGLYDGRFRLLSLKDEKTVEAAYDPKMSRTWNMLDVNVLQSFIFRGILGVDYKAAQEKGDLTFIKDAKKAVEKVRSGEFEAAFLINPTKIEEVYSIAKAGERMPQKSTYFYPKPLSGILMCRL
jgi:uncharacterized protein (DUF1015 family)